MSFQATCPGAYAPPALIMEPGAQRWGYGLESVATYLENQNEHERNGIKYKSFRCVGNVRNWEDNCTGPLAPKEPTDSGRDNVVVGCPFHLYAALNCKTTNLEAMAAEVEEVFNYGEQSAVETQVWNRVLATTAATVLNATSAPADAFQTTRAIAELEQAMAACYGAQATIHAPRSVAPFLFGEQQLNEADGTYYTKLGTKIAFYGGCPNSSPVGVVATAGHAWLYITSEITVRRWTPEILPEDVRLRLQYGAGMTNEPFIVAERTYVPSVECCQFAAQVTLVD